MTPSHIIIKVSTSTYIFWSKFITLSLFLALFSVSFPTYSQEVITNSNVQPLMTRNTLRSIYSMRLQTWADGQNITVFILDPQGEKHRKFCLEVLNIFPYQLQRVWDVLVFSGTGQSPIIVDSEEALIQQVKSTPGAIGYVVKSEVPLDVNKITID